MLFFDWLPKICGPPDFLNNCVQEDGSTRDEGPQKGRHGARNAKLRKDKKDLPAGWYFFLVNVCSYYVKDQFYTLQF